MKPLISNSSSQLQQDLFALVANNFKRKGFFVEIGASDGVLLSNTLLLETKYGWNGILVEPGLNWQLDLSKNRNCVVDFRCAWSKSGVKLPFSEAVDPGFSTLSNFTHSDHHANSRRGSKHYEVDSVSLNDLLEEYDAPKEIDYLSIDTEGSELEILSALNFGVYKFKAITVEHNFTNRRGELYELLSSNGYKRVLMEHSGWDDWYLYENRPSATGVSA